MPTEKKAVGIWTVRMLTKLNNKVKKQSLISFLKVSGKTEFRFEFSVKNYVFQHRTIFLHFLRKVYILTFL